ncbi:AAA family ATPase [Bacillus mycoides]|uniref:AAA family ATPase n=1 Tax=Bacillus mycoides TaxID=1405 RepID=UPI0034647D7D
MLVINNLKISGIGGISELEINFNKGLNLICGPNGVGKTTILDSIAEAFSTGQRNKVLKKNSNYTVGTCKLKYSIADFEEKNYTYEVQGFNPNEEVGFHSYLENEVYNLIYFKTGRSFLYQELGSISKDSERDVHKLYAQSAEGIRFDDFKSWFINRYVFNHIDEQLGESEKKNIELSIKSFNVLQENISFKNIKHDTFDIFLETPNGDIYYEYLSSGFKSCLFIIQGLIKEIEFRFKNASKIAVEDFQGVVLIDELDLHLHPHWQSKLLTILREILPKAQIIATTHSPHMIQNAAIEEIIPLAMDQNGKLVLRDLPNSKYGYQGWTVEEILVDVMGLESTHSFVYKENLKAFEEAIENENIEEAQLRYRELESMLHPNNPLPKILRLQIADIGGVVE